MNNFRAFGGSLFAAATVFMCAAPVKAQEAISAPPGWTADTKADGTQTLTPPDLKAGEVYRIAVYSSQPLDGKSLEDWLTGFAGPVGNAPGKLTAPLKISVKEGTVVSGISAYQGPNNTALIALFLGVSADGKNVHVLRVLLSSTELTERYKEAFNTVATGLAARAKREAGMFAVPIPAKVASMMKRGGKITPGVYVGNQYYGDELSVRYRVYLYASGEYRLCDHNDQDLKYNTGEFAYNPNNGRLSISSLHDLANNAIPSVEDYCFYGQGTDGKPMIYAEQDKGFRTTRTTLVYAGTGSRPAPAAEKAAKAAAEAEARRYKWVTAPGQGIKAAQIAAILYYSELAPGGGSMTSEEYLLLKDGTVHSELPVAIDMLDVTRSRQKEPQNWGRWRLVGGKYQVSWDGAPYQPMKGDKVLPGTAGQKLQGHWGGASSSGSLMGFGSYAFWGVTFGKDGRFSKDRRGGSSSGTIAAQTSGMASVNTAYDDEGSYVSATGDNFAIGSGKKGNPRASREGTYSINGYTLTLRYDNGKVERLPFFFISRDFKLLYFEGSQLSLDENEKK